MSRDLQIRSDLSNSVQQHANRAAGSLIARQLQAFTASGSLDPNKDTALCDTTDGTITMQLPLGEDKVKGLPFLFYKTAAANTLTVARKTGSGQTIEGSTSVNTTAVNTVIAVFWDGTVWRRLNASVAAGTGLLAANDLSDVADVPTARANLGLDKIYVPLRVTTLVGTGVYRTLAPAAGEVTAIHSIIEGVLTTGNATLTGKIGTTAITDGVITITQAGSAAGDKDVATPSALNVVAALDELSLTVGGTNATASAANCYFEITLT